MAEKKIDGKTFRVGKVLATEALLLKARILKMIGPSAEKLPNLLDGLRKDAKSEEKQGEAVKAIMEIFIKGDPQEMTDLLTDIVQIAEIKTASGYDQVEINRDFNDGLLTVYKVALFVLKEVFGDFFSASLGNGSQETIKG